ncbi:hypothetical protein ACFLSZ_04280 [Candidatus Bipolaricaulota bacterium]
MLAWKILATLLAVIGALIAVGDLIRRVKPGLSPESLIDMVGLKSIEALPWAFYAIPVLFLINTSAFVVLAVLNVVGVSPLAPITPPTIMARLADSISFLLMVGMFTGWKDYIGIKRRATIPISLAVAFGLSAYFTPFAATLFSAALLVQLTVIPLMLLLVLAGSLFAAGITGKILADKEGATSVSVVLLLLSGLIQIWIISK